MASLFNITTATNSVTLDAQRTGKASFTVSNTSAGTLRARARVTSPDASIVAWFTIEGQSGRIIAPAGTEQYTVDIAVPLSAAPKDYTFTLLVVDESNPDENFTEGPAVRVTVPAPLPAPPPKPFPWWIVAVAVVVLILVIVAIGLIVNQNNEARANANATSTAVAGATATAVALSCNPGVGNLIGPYNVNTGFINFFGDVVISFSLPQASNQAHQKFPAATHLSVLRGFPLCVAWTPVDFMCNRGAWLPFSGVPNVSLGGGCPGQLPPGVVDIQFR